MISVEPVTAPVYTLAEGPLWEPAGQRVLWVDIPEGLVCWGRLEGTRLAEESQHRFDGYVGAAVAALDGSLLVAETQALTRVAPDGTRTTMPLRLPSARDRLNDGICDAAGRFLVGSLSLDDDNTSAQVLVRVGSDSTDTLDNDLGLSNGLGFSPDGSVLYSVDSVPGTLWARDYDHESGAVGRRRLVTDFPDETPDGLCVDADGNLWLAVFGGSQVRCLSPAGELLERIDLPVLQPTSVAFVGAELDRLVITTAREGLDEAQLQAYPLSGSLFVADPGCRGLVSHPWSGVLPH
jgi:sugar lactone lactonase YvrE